VRRCAELGAVRWRHRSPRCSSNPPRSTATATGACGCSPRRRHGHPRLGAVAAGPVDGTPRRAGHLDRRGPRHDRRDRLRSPPRLHSRTRRACGRAGAHRCRLHHRHRAGPWRRRDVHRVDRRPARGRWLGPFRQGSAPNATG
jgi:hypothetical protein